MVSLVRQSRSHAGEPCASSRRRESVRGAVGGSIPPIAPNARPGLSNPYSTHLSAQNDAASRPSAKQSSFHARVTASP